MELVILTNCSGFSILCVCRQRTKTTNTVTYPSHSTIADYLYTPVLPLRHFNPFLPRQMATPAAFNSLRNRVKERVTEREVSRTSGFC